MKILFCAYDTPGLVASGPNAWIQRLIPDLRTAYGLDVEVLFIYKEQLEYCPTINFFKKNNLPYQVISRTQFPYIEDQVKLLLKLVKGLKFNVVVANLVIPAFYASKYLKPFGVPVVGVLHSNDAFYNSVLRQFVKSSKSISLSHLITVSKFLNRKAAGHNTNAISIETIPCGTPIEPTNESKTLDEPLKVVYAGRLVIEQKQIVQLVESFLRASRILKDTQYTIFGSGPEEEHLRSLILESKSASVHLGGAIPPAQIKEELSKNHVFTLMSDYEGMPIALMEAMSLGLVPVCLQEESGINEIIEHGVNGLIIKNRKEEFTEALNYLLNNPEAYNRMSLAAIQTINQSYSSKITHDKWANLLNGFRLNISYLTKVPSRVRLPKELLFYGDIRRPSLDTRLRLRCQSYWLEFRLFVRPRARLRTVFQLIKRNNK